MGVQRIPACEMTGLFMPKDNQTLAENVRNLGLDLGDWGAQIATAAADEIEHLEGLLQKAEALKPRIVIVLDDDCIQHVYTNVPGLTVVHEIDPQNDVRNRTCDLMHGGEETNLDEAHKRATREHDERSKRLLDGLKDIDLIKVYDDID